MKHQSRTWAERKRRLEAKGLREKARLIEPSGLHAVKAEYKDKVMRPRQTDMGLIPGHSVEKIEYYEEQVGEGPYKWTETGYRFTLKD